MATGRGKQQLAEKASDKLGCADLLSCWRRIQWCGLDRYCDRWPQTAWSPDLLCERNCETGQLLEEGWRVSAVHLLCCLVPGSMSGTHFWLWKQLSACSWEASRLRLSVHSLWRLVCRFTIGSVYGFKAVATVRSFLCLLFPEHQKHVFIYVIFLFWVKMCQVLKIKIILINHIIIFTLNLIIFNIFDVHVPLATSAKKNTLAQYKFEAMFRWEIPWF